MKGVDLDVKVDKYDLEFSAKDGAKSRESCSFCFYIKCFKLLTSQGNKSVHPVGGRHLAASASATSLT